MAETADQLVARIDAALLRVETARAGDRAATERLRELETVVEASIGELDTLLAAAR